jgi:hypothetical protein
LSERKAESSDAYVTGRIRDDNLVRWTLVLQERGGNGVTQVAKGASNADGVSLGSIDPS